MNTNQSQNITTFGWNRATHLKMTTMALDRINIDNKAKRQIARYSQMPDFAKEEIGFFNNTHFFFPNSKHKSFGLNSDSLNAFSFFNKHLTELLDSNDKEHFYKSLGYTLHYLQDMSVPLHTEPGNSLHKILKYMVHANFEKGKKYGATTNISALVENFKIEEIISESFADLFLDTAKFSQKPTYKVTAFNKKNWLKIQQDCFTRGINASIALIKKVFQSKENFLQNL